MGEFGETPKDVISVSNSEKKATKSEILTTADKIITAPIPLITDKSNSRSGDKRNFESSARYFHLDVNGKPVQRDTVLNPEVENDQDPKKLKTAENAIYILSMAVNASQDVGKKEIYKNYALSTIRTWFVNDETRMTPNLEFAAIKPGENTGNFWGIIDGVGLVQVAEGIGNMERAGLIDKVTLDGAKKWFGQYLDWLLTSEKGIGNPNAGNEKERGGERAMPNNHGAFYDVQVAYIADFLGKENVVKQALESTKERIKTQINPDGEMPEETRRGNMSLDYQVFNLFALSEMAVIAKKYNLDLWNETVDGKSIKQAFHYVYEQLKDKKSDVFQQNRTGELYYSFRAASQAYGLPDYWDLPQRIYNHPLADEVSAELFKRDRK